ncbi:energy transducer TonB [Acinetobacter ihumii]|uniref:energy transducer TonB n=1 Tax=Acinetobacter ihumii TaxID=2483802 RepID=UPI0010313320|nr:energy transducer TonB [Acinetobacter ihumii]
MTDIRTSLSKKALFLSQLTPAVEGTHSHTAVDLFAQHVSTHAPKPDFTWQKKLLVATAVVLAAHYGIWYLGQQFPTPTLPEKKAEPVLVELIQPKQQPPKIIQPKVIQPKIPPVTQQPKVPPVVQNVQPAQPVAKVESKPVAQAQPTKAVSQEAPMPVEAAPKAQVQAEPVVKAAPSAPVIKDLPVTEAKGYAGYLSNPSPEYPEQALDRGWEGSVLLRVKVSPSGSPLVVNLQSSSGKKLLDDAAINTVKRWKFSPALKGSTPVEGWVDVPIHFKLPN